MIKKHESRAERIADMVMICFDQQNESGCKIVVFRRKIEAFFGEKRLFPNLFGFLSNFRKKYHRKGRVAGRW
jgi:hypothetical protein